MSSVRNAAAALVGIKGIAVRDAANVLRSSPAAVIRDAGNVLRSFFSALAASASPTSVSGAVSSSTAASVTTDATTATPSAGTSPYTYAWAAADGNTWTINTPTAAKTSFTSPAIAPGVTISAFFRCTVTDAGGATTVTNNVEASATNLGSEGGGGTITP